MSQIGIGCGTVNITPGLGVYMPGYFEDRTATAIRDKLYARAMVFKNGLETAAIMCCDVIVVTRKQVASIRKIVGNNTNIPAENIMVGSTHTHTGPVPGISPDKEGAKPSLEWQIQQSLC